MCSTANTYKTKLLLFLLCKCHLQSPLHFYPIHPSAFGTTATCPAASLRRRPSPSPSTAAPPPRPPPPPPPSPPSPPWWAPWASGCSATACGPWPPSWAATPSPPRPRCGTPCSWRLRRSRSQGRSGRSRSTRGATLPNQYRYH